MLSGEDITALPFLAQGGDGCISVTSNIAPRPLCPAAQGVAEPRLRDHASGSTELLRRCTTPCVVETSPARGEICRLADGPLSARYPWPAGRARPGGARPHCGRHAPPPG
ncbi:MAG: hypothetical protein WDN69_23305 [Aliidongia sp.]